METITYNDTPKALILDVILSFGFLKNNHYLCGQYSFVSSGAISLFHFNV